MSDNPFDPKPQPNPFASGLLDDIDNALSGDKPVANAGEAPSHGTPPPIATQGIDGNIANTVAAGKTPPAKVVKENLGPQKEVLSSTAITSVNDQEAASQAQGHQAIVNPNPLSIAPVNPQQEAINQRDAHNNSTELQVHARESAETVAAAVTEPAVIKPGDLLGRQPGDPNSPVDLPKDLVAAEADPNKFPRGLTDEQLAAQGFSRVDLFAPPVPEPQPGGNRPVDLPPAAIENVLEPVRRTVSAATQAELQAGTDAVSKHQTVLLPVKQEGDKPVAISAKTLAELQTGRRAVNERS